MAWLANISSPITGHGYLSFSITMEYGQLEGLIFI